jgi:hypothetical protein
MMRSRLLYNRYQESTVLSIINPYNNRVLKKSELYNIYIDCYEDRRNIDWLLKEFARLEFNLNEFRRVHKDYLTDHAIRCDIKDMDDDDFIRECDESFQRFFIDQHLCYKKNIYVFTILKCIDINILRIYFSKVLYNITLETIALNNLNESYDIELYKEETKRCRECRSILMKFWILYPHIYAKKIIKKHKRFNISKNNLRTS